MRLLRPPPRSVELSVLGRWLCSPHTTPAVWPPALGTPLQARSLPTAPSKSRPVCTVGTSALGFFQLCPHVKLIKAGEPFPAPRPSLAWAVTTRGSIC